MEETTKNCRKPGNCWARRSTPFSTILILEEFHEIDEIIYQVKADSSQDWERASHCQSSFFSCAQCFWAVSWFQIKAQVKSAIEIVIFLSPVFRGSSWRRNKIDAQQHLTWNINSKIYATGIWRNKMLNAGKQVNANEGIRCEIKAEIKLISLSLWKSFCV